MTISEDFDLNLIEAHSVQRGGTRDCLDLQELGFGLTKDVVAPVVGQYLTDTMIPNHFQQGIPCESWWQGFMKRWPMLSQRKPEHLTTKRTQSLTHDVIK